jgi:hypothetical protein
VPALVALGIALAGVAGSWKGLAWFGLGGATGYALSGSV